MHRLIHQPNAQNVRQVGIKILKQGHPVRFALREDIQMGMRRQLVKVAPRDNLHRILNQAYAQTVRKVSIKIIQQGYPVRSAMRDNMQIIKRPQVV